MPSGTGLLGRVDLIVSSRVSDSELISSVPYQLVGYSSPQVTQVFHQNCSSRNASLVECSREGGGLVTIHGMNFGSDSAVVLIGGVVPDVQWHDPDTPHSVIYCDLPAGSAVDAIVLLIQLGGATYASGDVTVVKRLHIYI